MDYKIKHLGIIVDGNGRWATKLGLKRSEGHKAGADNIDKIIETAYENKISIVSLYLFSTENFKRESSEVNYIFKLIKQKFKKDLKKFLKENIKVVVSGRREPLPLDVLEVLDEIVDKTKHLDNSKVLNLCINYGSTYEILDMVKNINNNLTKEEINKLNTEDLYKYMYNNLEPIDLLIRTSGEQRLSNFMLLQLNYAELIFLDKYFPELEKEDLIKTFEDFKNRERRFGGTK